MPASTFGGGQAALLTFALAAPALAYDLTVQSAAVDQPRINFAVARAGAPTTPLIGQDPFGDDTIFVQGFYDTGASGVVIAGAVADALGIERQQVGGELVFFGDASPTGIVPFNVSEPLAIRLADNWGAFDGGLAGDPQRVADLSSPSNFTTLYDEGFSPIRSQITLGDPNPVVGDLNVIGMPAMIGRKIVMDARPTNNFRFLLDDDPTNDTFDVQMRTFVHSPGEPTGPTPPFNPGVPAPDVNVSLSYADFSSFTTLSPAGAVPPTLAQNPFIGPNPLLNNPNDATPPITMMHNDQTANGSFLLDTGAAASFISQGLAGQIGVAYDQAAPLGSEAPRLTGVDLENQFTLQITGISGEIITIAGFFADNMLVRTDEGDATNSADPNHLNFRGAPVLVFDIEVFDEVANRTVILDGIFGMNYLVATANLIADDFFPILLDPTDAPFDFITFDEPAGKLGLTFATVPEPSAAALMLSAGLLALRRRHRHV